MKEHAIYIWLVKSKEYSKCKHNIYDMYANAWKFMKVDESVWDCMIYIYIYKHSLVDGTVWHVEENTM